MISSREIIKKIEADGWKLKRINGDHHHFDHPTKKGLVTVPHPKRDFGHMVIKSIERQSGVKLR